MNKFKLNIISEDLLQNYKEHINNSTIEKFKRLEDSPLSISSFSFYSSVSAVYSSKIEGEDIELDSYVKHKRFGIEFKPDYTRKIDDLYSAYEFAQSNTLNAENINFALQLLTKNILPESKQGKIRTTNMHVTTPDGKIEYVAASPFVVAPELDKLFKDIGGLLQDDLSFEEVFFFAAMIHLIFVKIHPFDDGNGRTARLLEKWFIAEKLGKSSWYIESEKQYYQNHSLYYQHIRRLGLEYELLDYSKALPFLLMLPESLHIE
ncbi:MAG: Fic family protein [Saprospiraceae bacterium]